MYESDFVLIEGETMTREGLRQELEAIVGNGVTNDYEKSVRKVVKKPAPEQDFETFDLTFRINDSYDFISVVVTVPKKKQLSDYNLDEQKLNIKLISYNQREGK